VLADNIEMDFQEVGCEGGGAWTGLMWPGYRHVSGMCKRGNELSGSIKCWEFLD
jgi:hypothetical protein